MVKKTTKIKTKKIKTEKEHFKKKGRISHYVLIGLMGFLITCALACLSFCVYIIIDSPEFDVNLLYKSSSSVLYDKNGEVFAELGAQRRENITYDALPEILIDAIIATEDSKFFQHSGIDLLRFGKAVLGQLLGRSDAGGGSTLTMQIVKNTYNGTESRGIEGIIRKFKDIYMSVFKVEKTYTKQEILEFYVNQANLGAGAYGVAQAAETYFGKSVSELNLSEAATIAGLFQAPTAYNPYAFPEKAQSRRDRVLSLMVRHKYITEKEAAAAKAINVKDMLSGYSSSSSKYQGFIDTLVVDIYNKTGYDPATTSMSVYTTLDPSKQDVINQLYDGTLYNKWKNDKVQCAIAVTDVKTGAITAIGTRRFITGERQYNYATSINRHPGSTAKPIFDYGPAIEYEGWGTGNLVVDDVYSYTNGPNLNNVDRKYRGIMTAKTALAHSRNVPALQVFQATSQEDKYEFVTNLGIKPELIGGQILESSSIGAFNGVSPLELSAAYAAFAREGYYIEPYTYTKIILNDTNETITYSPSRTKAMSEETAYMINMMLKYAVTSGVVKATSVSGTDIAGKTGTTSVDSKKAKELGLSNNAINDTWQAVYTPDYSIAFWYGYDQNTKEFHLTSTEGSNARNDIARILTPRIFEKNARWEKPKGVVSVDIELETNPVMLASENTPDALRSTELYRKGTEPTEVSPRFMTLDNVSNLTYSITGNQAKLSWSPIDTPDVIDPVYLQKYFETGFTNWADKYYQQRLEYNRGNIGNLVYEVFIRNADGTLSSLGTTSNTSFNTTLPNSPSTSYVVKSTYSIFKGSASPGREITIKQGQSTTTPPDDNDSEEDNENNEE